MKKFLMLMACMALLSGCTQSNIVQPTAETKVADPDFDIKEDVSIDWQQVSLDAEDVFENKNDFPYSDNFSFRLDPNGKKIFLIWVVSDEFPDSELQNYMESLIKGFNDVVATQDFSIEKSNANAYGGLWKNYELSFGIAPSSTQDDQETWFINATYPAGSEFVLPDVNSAIERANKADQDSEDADTDDAGDSEDVADGTAGSNGSDAAETEENTADSP